MDLSLGWEVFFLVYSITLTIIFLAFLIYICRKRCFGGKVGRTEVVEEPKEKNKSTKNLKEISTISSSGRKARTDVVHHEESYDERDNRTELDSSGTLVRVQVVDNLQTVDEDGNIYASAKEETDSGETNYEEVISLRSRDPSVSNTTETYHARKSSTSSSSSSSSSNSSLDSVKLRESESTNKEFSQEQFTKDVDRFRASIEETEVQFDSRRSSTSLSSSSSGSSLNDNFGQQTTLNHLIEQPKLTPEKALSVSSSSGSSTPTNTYSNTVQPNLSYPEYSYIREPVYDNVTESVIISAGRRTTSESSSEEMIMVEHSFSGPRQAPNEHSSKIRSSSSSSSSSSSDTEMGSDYEEKGSHVVIQSTYTTGVHDYQGTDFIDASRKSSSTSVESALDRDVHIQMATKVVDSDSDSNGNRSYVSNSVHIQMATKISDTDTSETESDGVTVVNNMSPQYRSKSDSEAEYQMAEKISITSSASSSVYSEKTTNIPLATVHLSTSSSSSSLNDDFITATPANMAGSLSEQKFSEIGRPNNYSYVESHVFSSQDMNGVTSSSHKGLRFEDLNGKVKGVAVKEMHGSNQASVVDTIEFHNDRSSAGRKIIVRTSSSSELSDGSDNLRERLTNFDLGEALHNSYRSSNTHPVVIRNTTRVSEKTEPDEHSNSDSSENSERNVLRMTRDRKVGGDLRRKSSGSPVPAVFRQMNKDYESVYGRVEEENRRKREQRIYSSSNSTHSNV